MIELINFIIALESFVTLHWRLISFLFGALAALGAVSAITYRIWNVCVNKNRAKSAHRKSVSDQFSAMENKMYEVQMLQAQQAQRRDFQAEFMSEQEKRYSKMDDKISSTYQDVADIKAASKAVKLLNKAS